MKTTDISFSIPVNSFGSHDFRALVASCSNRTSNTFFHRDEAGNPLGDVYPEVIFYRGWNKDKEDRCKVKISALQGHAADELLSILPEILNALQKRFEAPCPFRIHSSFPSVKEFPEEMRKYRIVAPVITRKKIINNNDVPRKEIEVMLENCIRTGIDRFSRRSGVAIGHFGFFCDPLDTKLIPVQVQKKQGNFSYLFLREAEFIANLEIKGPVHVGGLSTYGHGRIFPC